MISHSVWMTAPSCPRLMIRRPIILLNKSPDDRLRRKSYRLLNNPSERNHLQAGTSEGPLVPTLTVPNRPAVTAPKPPAPDVTPPIILPRGHKTNSRVAYIAAVPLMLISLILGVLFIFASRCPTLTVTARRARTPLVASWMALHSGLIGLFPRM
jgi:hypothetical protein